MLLHLKRVRCLSVSVFLLLLVIAGCMSGAGGGGDQGGGSGSDTSNSPGGDTGGDTGGGTGGGTGGDTGGGTGTGTGGDTGTGGTGGTGGGTGGTGDTGTVYGTFATLYTATDVSTEVVSCVNPASGIKSFSSAVLRVIGQNGNFVDAVLTLTPNQDFVAEFDQIFVNLSGEFQADGSFLGTISNIIYSLNGNVLVQAIGSITINVFGASISVEFTADMQNPDCGLAGGFFMTESTDTGTGGGTGGDTGGGTGGTGGTGGGGTGTGSATTGTDGSVVQATGDFGILTFDSTDHPEDSGSYQLTSALLLTYVGQEVFAWYNAEQTTVNVYFGFGDTQTAQGFMTFNSANGRNYICDCFPSIDLVNYEASFNNLILSDSNIPPGTISINGVLAFPTAN